MSKFIQFIAGAVCPSCKAQDTIAINTEDDLIYCVKCDFKEKRPVLKEKNNQSINVINIDDFKASKS
ncbi:MAG: YheV family putative metal-binding protein [SAR86 cluster bacterium]|jgi:uncharacterized metal-binding protein (TIGR02443 family)|nr:YheV family putative metal-binding protein [SAR86 cluster bacterium]